VRVTTRGVGGGIRAVAEGSGGLGGGAFDVAAILQLFLKKKYAFLDKFWPNFY